VKTRFIQYIVYFNQK